MTHLLLIYVPEKPKFRYTIALPFTYDKIRGNLIDFGTYKTDEIIYSDTGHTFAPKKPRGAESTFYGWYSIELYKYRLKTYHTLPLLRPEGVIGYHGWRELKHYRNKDRWRELDTENGWILTGDNHDFARDDLYAFLWAENIEQFDDIRVFIESTIAHTKNEITKLVMKIKSDIILEKLNENTNPITNLNAIISYKFITKYTPKLLPLEEFDPTRFYNIS